MALVFPTYTIETQAVAQGLGPVAGIDEAGRGPLAGPVVAAAVILDAAAIPSGLADSKMLTEERREALYAEIMQSALAVACASASPACIDRINIRQATLQAMSACVRALAIAPRHVLVDGRDVPPLPLGMSGEAIVAGDSSVVSIAAASIIAKVHRDRLMRRLGLAHPHYGFEVHKGYGTVAHRAAIADHGPTSDHRRTFGTLKDV